MWTPYPCGSGHFALGSLRLVLVLGPAGLRRAYWADGSGAAWCVAPGRC